MRVVFVIHGFPPDYMAGSEVHSYHLVKAMQKQVEKITVYTRFENEFMQEYGTIDEIHDGIEVHRINRFMRDYSYREKFYDEAIEEDFRNYLNNANPDIVHFGHLSHLSVRLPYIVKEEYQLPIVYTIHDFWLSCVKGQLINQDGHICSGPSAGKCHLCSPYQTSVEEVQGNLEYMQSILQLIDVFFVPSHTLRNYFIEQGVPDNKLIYSKYGFDTEKITYKEKRYNHDSVVRFGFMGRIIPTKGIHVLIEAFKDINAQLSIYGNVGNQKRFLQQENIRFKGGYDNNDVNRILSEIDVLIVPSVWLENSPMVIQEAFLAGVPVITSNIGGMKELVSEGVNGFLFEVGSSQSLKDCVLRLVHNPDLLNQLSVSRESVRTMEDDADCTVTVYKNMCKK